MSDDEIVGRLLAAAPEAIVALEAALSAYRAARPAPVPWSPMTGAGTPEDPHHLPYPQYAPEVHALTGALVDAGAMPVFAWMDREGAAAKPTIALVRSAPLADVLRMTTVLIRGERFSDGSIAEAVDSGALPAIAERALIAWHRARRQD